ncbi:MAG: hypothetical protein MJZ82_03760 [Paludibacteraceae bacterium]|nr:hypothetical protein [Paludibacteraceae bacterium]
MLQALLKAGYQPITFQQYCQGDKPQCKWVILRHDVDLKAMNSLHTAQLEKSLGICASYYFRVVPQSNQPEIIRQIAEMGHEIGYHYEDLSMANGSVNIAIVHFAEHLAYFRRFYPVSTICMHGAPTSKYDGRDLWKSYDYHQYDIIGEPYFDIDFNHVLYLTDTGRQWDGYKVSVRDKVAQQDEWCRRGLVFHKTDDLINGFSSVLQNVECMMITTHPQRWTDHKIEWLKEFLAQNLKNIVKRILIYGKTHLR